MFLRLRQGQKFARRLELPGVSQQRDAVAGEQFLIRSRVDQARAIALDANGAGAGVRAKRQLADQASCGRDELGISTVSSEASAREGGNAGGLSGVGLIVGSEEGADVARNHELAAELLVAEVANAPGHDGGNPPSCRR